jgi:hypothetical protein
MEPVLMGIAGEVPEQTLAMVSVAMLAIGLLTGLFRRHHRIASAKLVQLAPAAQAQACQRQCCTKCGNVMVMRMMSQKQAEPFGCSSFPRCKGVQD